MTSRISLVKLMKEEFRHHIISIFATILVFLAEILFFYFDIQRMLQYKDTIEYIERVAAAGEPSFSAMLPTIVLGVLLAADYFNHLHSQKKTDFYMSLPVTRREKYWLGVMTCGITYFIPCIIASVCECLIGYATGFGTSLFLQNMIWKLICKILIFLACFVTMTLAMIMTGNFVIAMMGFGAFCVYVPALLKYLVPAFEELFFDTCAGINKFPDGWNYFSPVSLGYGLVMDYETWTIGRHMNYLIAIIIFVIILGVLAQFLYVKRPAEAAGRAMAFTKTNSVIRFLVVVPIALYCGYFLQQTAPGREIIWLYIGTIVGVVLIHGIMESIFRFDLRGLLGKKKQLLMSLLVCCAFILIFQLDFMKYDEFVPDVDKVESVEIMPNSDAVYFYYDTYTSKLDGIYGETIQDVIILAEKLAKQNDQIVEDIQLQNEISSDIGWITIKYQMKNGSFRAREYYMDLGNDEIRELLNKICSTEEFKNDYYALYGMEAKDVEKITIDDVIQVHNLLLTEEEQKEFIEIYLSDLSALSYTEMEEKAKIAKFTITYAESAGMEYFLEETYPIFESFENTIHYLSEYGEIELNGTFADCEMISLEVSEEYISEQEGMEAAFTVNNKEVLEEVKKELLVVDLYNEGYVTGVKDSRFGTVEVIVNGRCYSYDVYLRPETEKKLKEASE